jgi:predicted nucleotidyltransferase
VFSDLFAQFSPQAAKNIPPPHAPRSVASRRWFIVSKPGSFGFRVLFLVAGADGRLHGKSVTLLQQRDRARRERRLNAFAETRSRLRAALAATIPGHQVIVFGSLTRPGVFNDCSDVDLALGSEPPGMSVWRLTAELMGRLNRPVDVVLLDRCQFREKILREGEVWIA